MLDTAALTAAGISVGAVSSGAEGNDEGWEPFPGAGEPVEKLDFDTLDFLDELAHPTRQRIMRRLRSPATIAEVAAHLEVPVTRLYHHVNRLERAGMIRVVATRQVAAVTERRYQVVARSFGTAPDFFESRSAAESAAALGSVFDMAKLGLQREVENGALQVGDEDKTMVSFGFLRLTEQRRAELLERLEAVVAEFSADHNADTADDADDLERVAVFISAHPESD